MFAGYRDDGGDGGGDGDSGGDDGSGGGSDNSSSNDGADNNGGYGDGEGYGGLGETGVSDADAAAAANSMSEDGGVSQSSLNDNYDPSQNPEGQSDASYGSGNSVTGNNAGHTNTDGLGPNGNDWVSDMDLATPTTQNVAAPVPSWVTGLLTVAGMVPGLGPVASAGKAGAGLINALSPTVQSGWMVNGQFVADPGVNGLGGSPSSPDNSGGDYSGPSTSGVFNPSSNNTSTFGSSTNYNVGLGPSAIRQIGGNVASQQSTADTSNPSNVEYNKDATIIKPVSDSGFQTLIALLGLGLSLYEVLHHE